MSPAMQLLYAFTFLLTLLRFTNGLGSTSSAVTTNTGPVCVQTGAATVLSAVPIASATASALPVLSVACNPAIQETSTSGDDTIKYYSLNGLTYSVIRRTSFADSFPASTYCQSMFYAIIQKCVYDTRNTFWGGFWWDGSTNYTILEDEYPMVSSQSSLSRSKSQSVISGRATGRNSVSGSGSTSTSASISEVASVSGSGDSGNTRGTGSATSDFQSSTISACTPSWTNGRGTLSDSSFFVGCATGANTLKTASASSGSIPMMGSAAPASYSTRSRPNGGSASSILSSNRDNSATRTHISGSVTGLNILSTGSAGSSSKINGGIATSAGYTTQSDLQPPTTASEIPNARFQPSSTNIKVPTQTSSGTILNTVTSSDTQLSQPSTHTGSSSSVINQQYPSNTASNSQPAASLIPGTITAPPDVVIPSTPIASNDPLATSLGYAFGGLLVAFAKNTSPHISAIIHDPTKKTNFQNQVDDLLKKSEQLYKDRG